MRAGPLFEVPLIPRPHRGQSQLRILGHLLEALAGEARKKRRKVHRGVDPVEVHVVDALVDIPRPTAHLVETGRFHPPLVDRATDHRVEPDVGELGTVVEPGLAPIIFFDHAGGTIGELARHPVLEDVRWFDDVVISGDHRVLAFRGGRIRKKGDRARTVVAAALSEAAVRCQIVERDHEVTAVPLARAGAAGARRRRSTRPSRARSARP
jgi:hypothetical protein